MAGQHDKRIADLLRRTARSLLQEHAFDRAAGLARAAADPDLTVLCEFQSLVAREMWAPALQIACDHLRRNAFDGDMRAAVVQVLSQPGRSAAAIAPLEALAADEGVTVIACALCLVAYAVNDRGLNLGIVSPRVWSVAFFWILDECQPELLDRLLAVVLPHTTQDSLVRDLAEVVARAPEPSEASTFVDRRGGWLQFVPASHPETRALLVCLCGLDGRIGLPLNLFHRWAARLPAHIVYLRDPSNTGFAQGIRELGEGFAALADFMRTLARMLGAQHLGLYGNSKGGFAAARLGAMVGARRVVVAGGVALQTQFGSAPATPEVLEAARRSASAEIGDLLRSSGNAMEIVAVHARGIVRDAADAASLAGIPGTRLWPLERNRHNVATALARDGALEPLLRWAAGEGATESLLPPARS